MRYLAKTILRYPHYLQHCIYEMMIEVCLDLTMMIEVCLDLTNTLTLIFIVLARLKHYAKRHSFHSDTLFWLRAKKAFALKAYCYELCGEAAKTILTICLTLPWIEPAMSHTLLSIKKCATISKYLLYVATIYIVHMNFYINEKINVTLFLK